MIVNDEFDFHYSPYLSTFKAQIDIIREVFPEVCMNVTGNKESTLYFSLVRLGGDLDSVGL